MNILITGATGFVGQELRPHLLKEGHNLVIVTRNPKKYEDESAKNQRFIGWGDHLAKEMNNVDAVINLAGENIFRRWTEAGKKRIKESRIESTRKLVNAMKNADKKPAVLVSVSAVNVYKDHGSEKVDEQSELGNGFMAEVCKAWERESQKASELGVRVVNPRLGLVLEREEGVLGQMIPPFEFFAGGPIGRGSQYMSWIHRTDLCRALQFLIENEQLEGAFNTCSPEPVTMDEFAQTLGDVLNRPSWFRVPEFGLNLVLGDLSQLITESVRMVPVRLQDAGFQFQYEELEEALADIV